MTLTFDHWIETIRLRDAIGRDDIPETVSPFAKIQAIASVYFPQFDELICELDRASDGYRVWIYAIANKRISKEPLTLGGFNDAYDPYAQKRKALLDALKAFAHDEFQ